MKVSLVMITMNRVEIVKHTMGVILNNAGHDFELLVADNGSTDGVIEYIESLHPKVHLINGENKGVACALNELIKCSSADLVCHIGNDIIMTGGWLKSLVYHHESIVSTGVCAIHTVEVLPPLSTIGDLGVHLSKIVFGPKAYRRKVVGKTAYKAFSKYGFEDSDLSLRLYYAGYYNYYVPGMKGNHVGHDMETDSEYRRMKTRELAKSHIGFVESVNEYKNHDMSKY